MEEERTFPADPMHLADVRRFIRECASQSGFQGSLDDLLLSVSEAAANAVAHSGSPRFRVAWRSAGDEVEITVEDDGIFRRRAGAPELDGVSHRGLLIIAATVDEVQLIKGVRRSPGTTVKMVKRAGS